MVAATLILEPCLSTLAQPTASTPFFPLSPYPLFCQQIPLDKVWYKALQPEGGASGVGESLLKYASANGSTMIVVGNRDLGFFKRCVFIL